jgi:hypothetical protein
MPRPNEKSSQVFLCAVGCETDLHSKTPAGGAGQLESGTHKYLTRGKSERRVGTHARDTRGPTLIKLVTHRKRIAVVWSCLLTRVNPFFLTKSLVVAHPTCVRSGVDGKFMFENLARAKLWTASLARCATTWLFVRKKRVHTYCDTGSHIQYRYHRRQGRVRWGRPLLSRPRGAVDSGPAAVLAAVVC